MVEFKEVQAKKVLGVGRKLSQTIKEFLDTGKCEKLERLKTEW